MDTLTFLVNSLIAAGGIGFINIFILLRLDRINFTKDNKEDKTLFLIFFSIINYSLYLLFIELLSHLLNNRILLISLCILLTLIASIILSVFIWLPISKMIISKINQTRKKEQLSSYDSRSIKKMAFSFTTNKPIYIFDFDNRLIFSGMSGWFSDLDGADLEFLMTPFNEKSELDCYEKLIDFIQSEEVDSDIYVNADKKLKIIIIN